MRRTETNSVIGSYQAQQCPHQLVNNLKMFGLDFFLKLSGNKIRRMDFVEMPSQKPVIGDLQEVPQGGQEALILLPVFSLVIKLYIQGQNHPRPQILTRAVALAFTSAI